MDHPLDNPAWSALISGNRRLANGNDVVKYFDQEVSPFAGLRENTAENFQLLYDLVPHDGTVGFISPRKMEIPGPWTVVHCISGHQMIYNGHTVPYYTGPELVPLTTEHVPQMLALTKLTNPGPFASRTIEFGHYYGIFDSDNLVAMTGQRLHAFNYAEVSAVCTHPDYLGQGYARQLLLFHINRILAASCIPILHVKYGNDRAIDVYRRCGFTTRAEIHFYFMVKAK